MLFNLDDKRVYGLVLADFQKALDLVSHNVPIEKLRIYGLDEFSLGLIRSFLHNRRQRTVIRGSAQSSSQTLMHGVPQGSVLSPLLFLVFINDLPKGVLQPTTVDIFADDTTLSLSSPYTDTSGLCSKLCDSTRELENWSRNNRFKLNTEKAKSMFITATRLRTKIGGTSVNEMRIFTSKGEELDNTRSHKLLGVYVDQDLSVDEHIEQLRKKLAKRIGLLRSIRQYLPLNERTLFLQHNC